MRPIPTLTAGRWWARWMAIAHHFDDQLDSRRVPCPTCGARKGVKCKRPSGHSAWDAHALRFDSALFDAEREVEQLSPAEAGTGYQKFAAEYFQTHNQDVEVLVELLPPVFAYDWLHTKDEAVGPRDVSRGTRKRIKEKGYKMKYLAALTKAAERKLWLPYLTVPGIPIEEVSDTLYLLVIEDRFPIFVVNARYKKASDVAWHREQGKKELEGGLWSHYVSMSTSAAMPHSNQHILTLYGYELLRPTKPSYLSKRKAAVAKVSQRKAAAAKKSTAKKSTAARKRTASK